MAALTDARGALWLLTVATAVALPYVRIEPAPVDAAMALAALAAALAGLGAPRALVLGATLYAAGNAVAIAAGQSVGRTPADFVARYLVIETLILTAILGFAAIFQTRPALLRSFLRAYVVGAVISALAVWVLRFGWPDTAPIFRDETRVRLQGFFRDPNVLGPFLLFPIAALLYARGGLGLRSSWRLALVPLTALAVLTFSRAAWIGLVIVAAPLLARLIRTRAPRATLAAAAALGALGLATLMLTQATAPPIAAGPPAATAEAAYLGQRLSLQGYDSHRFADLAAAVRLAASHPLGLGPAGFGRLTGTNNAHNLFLGKLTDAGLIPALLIVALPLAGAIAAWRARHATQGLGVALAITLAAHLVISMVIYSHHWRHMMLLAVAGLALPALARIEGDPTRPSRRAPRGILANRLAFRSLAGPGWAAQRRAAQRAFHGDTPSAGAGEVPGAPPVRDGACARPPGQHPARSPLTFAARHRLRPRSARAPPAALCRQAPSTALPRLVWPTQRRLPCPQRFTTRISDPRRGTSSCFGKSVMIDLKHRIIFLHLPKTAGTSVERWFLDLRGLRPLDEGALGVFTNPRRARLERANGHASLEMVEDLVFGGDIPPDFRLFTIVRDPLARLLSEWSYRRVPSPRRLGFGLRLPLRLMLAEAAEPPHPLAPWLRDLRAHLRPQSAFLRGRAAERVRVLRFETLARDFAALQADWGLPVTPLPRENTTARKRRPTPAQLIRAATFARDFYAEDYAQFGYALPDLPVAGAPDRGKLNAAPL